MAKVTFKINPDGIKQLLNGAEISGDLERRANQIAGVAGEGWEVASRLSFKGDRASATVFTNDPKTAAINRRDHTLMRSIDAGRG